MPTATKRCALLFSLLLACACGSEDPGDGGGPALPEGDLLPWRVGNTWTYRVTEQVGEVVPEPTAKTTTVGEEEPVGGAGPHAGELANHVVTTNDDGDDETESWQAKVGDRTVRYREISYDRLTDTPELEEYWDPPRLRVDQSAERLLEGAAWLETYQEFKDPANVDDPNGSRTDSWKVLGVGVEVEVPAGTFSTLHLQKAAKSGAIKQYYFAPGVGKVKELGSEKPGEVPRTEELVSWDVGDGVKP